MEGDHKHMLVDTKEADMHADGNVTPRDHITAKNQQMSRLLQMPAEIRNRIYEYALKGHKFDVSTPILLCDFQSEGARHSVALIRTCRQIHAEASLMVFSTNTFYLDLWYPGGGKELSFLRDRSKAQLESIQSCTVIDGYEASMYLVLDMLPNLCSLRLTICGMICMGSIKDGVIDLYYKDLHNQSGLLPRLRVVAAMIRTWKPSADIKLRVDEDMATELED